MSRSRGRLLALAVSFPLLGGCLIAPERFAAAADAAIYREGDFKQSDINMVACPAALLSKRHPDVQFVIGMTDGHFSVTGSPANDKSAAIWVIVAKSTGPQSSHVELHRKAAATAELNEIWQTIEICEQR